MEINSGDLVIFKKGLYQDEEGMVYRVLEVNGDRTILELVSTKMAIRPQSVAMLSDLELFSEKGKGKMNH
jgi:hypothetical protein